MDIAEQIRLRMRRRVANHLELLEAREKALKANPGNKKQARENVRDVNRERMTPRQFVRAFGDKVARYRLTDRADFIGLMVLGKEQGIMVTGNADGSCRKLRVVDVLPSGHISVTKRFFNLKDHESVSNLWRGLLKWVR